MRLNIFTIGGALICSPGCEMAGARVSVRLCELQEHDQSVNMDGRCLQRYGVLTTLEFDATFWNFVGQAAFFVRQYMRVLFL